MLNTILNAAVRGGLRNVLGGATRARGGAGGALGGVAGQAALAAALGMLLKRGGGGRLLKVGGLAALGMMAYNAWQEHQAKQGGASAQAPAGGAKGKQAFAKPPAADDDDGDDETQEQALLVAMIAAAKADGHVDDHERAQIEQVLSGAEGGADLKAWLDAELKRPLDAAAVARPAAGNDELASKMFLASTIVVGGGDGHVSANEQAWLDALARELKLPAPLVASLRKQASQLA